MDRKYLKRNLFHEIGSALKEEGYRVRVSQSDLIKKFDRGKISIHLGFIDYVEGFDVTIDVGIRFEELENLKNQYKDFLTKTEKKETYTIGVELGNLAYGEQKKWNIKKGIDILPVSQNIIKEIKKHFFPYVSHYLDIENLFEACIKDDTNEVVAFDSEGAENAVCLAMLLKKEHMLNSIIDQKRTYLKRINRDELESFEEFLLNMRLNQ